jgi:hypothetical protein
VCECVLDAHVCADHVRGQIRNPSDPSVWQNSPLGLALRGQPDPAGNSPALYRNFNPATTALVWAPGEHTLCTGIHACGHAGNNGRTIFDGIGWNSSGNGTFTGKQQYDYNVIAATLGGQGASSAQAGTIPLGVHDPAHAVNLANNPANNQFGGVGPATGVEGSVFPDWKNGKIQDTFPDFMNNPSW